MVAQSPEPGAHVKDARLFTIYSTMGKDQTTTPGSPCPTLCDECVGSLTSPADHNSEDAGDGAYGFIIGGRNTPSRIMLQKLKISIAHTDH